LTDTIGIVGGGQLGRMLTQAALPLGFRVVVVDPTEDCPAAQVGAVQIRAPLADTDAIDELAARCDVVTWEIEHIPAAHLQSLATVVEPSPVTLATVQDKLAQKQLLAAHGIPVGPFAPSVEPDRTGGFVVKAR
jgi:5-(carboxyamino)imidazole ribonucleotide synthase